MNRWPFRMGILFIMFVLVVSGCGGGKTEPSAEKGKLKISASMYPLAFFAEQIGGDHVSVTNLVPPGVDAHDFEPTPKDVAKMADSQVFLYNGIGMEGWVDKVKGSLKEKTLLVNTSKGIPLLKSTHEHGHEHGEHEHGHEKHGHEEHGHEHGHEGHAHGDHDPHVWLDPIRAKQQAAHIKDALVKEDPKHQEDYEQNYEQLAQRLEDIDQSLKETVKKAKGKSFIVSHAAFGYLADRYGLNQIPISGLSPSEEPSPKKLREIVKTAREHQVKYILFETLVSSKVAKTVQKEVGTDPLTIHTLEGLTQQEQSQGEDYFTLMEKNADHLGKALETK